MTIYFNTLLNLFINLLFLIHNLISIFPCPFHFLNLSLPSMKLFFLIKEFNIIFPLNSIAKMMNNFFLYLTTIYALIHFYIYHVKYFSIFVFLYFLYFYLLIYFYLYSFFHLLKIFKTIMFFNSPF